MLLHVNLVREMISKILREKESRIEVIQAKTIDGLSFHLS